MIAILFTIEYTLRIRVVRRKSHYIFSFFRLVDLLSIKPTYPELFVAGTGHSIIITTVEHGDITPITVFGKMLASIRMLTGFAIIAVPTGIVTAELHRELEVVKLDTRVCEDCGHESHVPQALHRNLCGHKP
ncbi:MAG: potassium channel family protein [Verrucomicrobia bacterium]|nr:potassium channel family protein [Verrucomicrobiota bacterium]